MCCSVAIWIAAFIVKGNEQKNVIICVKKNHGSLSVHISKTFESAGKTAGSVSSLWLFKKYLDVRVLECTKNVCSHLIVEDRTG